MKTKFRFNPAGTTASVQGGWLAVEADPRRTVAEITHLGQAYLLLIKDGGLQLEEYPKKYRPAPKEPPPFNPEYRPGLAEALDKAYTAHCDAYPDLTLDELAACYLQIHARLLPSYPRVSL
jgi:hypothetical protein